MRSVKRFLPVLSVGAVVVWLLLGPARPAAAAPLGEADVAKLLELGVDSQAIITSIHESGIGFRTDTRMLDGFKKAGASKEVLDALSKAHSGPAGQPAAAPARAAITYRDVLRLLDLKIGEDAILRRIADSHSTFTLDAKQIEDLKSKGATDRLLSAMRPGSPQAGTVQLRDLAIVVDCSKRMAEKTADGVTRMDAVRNVLARTVRAIPDGVRLTLVIYGPPRRLGPQVSPAQASYVSHPLEALNDSVRDDLTLLFAMLAPGGDAPVAHALETAGKELAKSDRDCAIILIAAGGDTFKGDPAGEVAKLIKNPKLKSVSVIGLGLSADEQKAMELVATAGKGKFQNVQTSVELANLLAPKTETTVVRGQASGTAGRRALRVMVPVMSLPKLGKIAVVADNGHPPGVPYYKPVLQVTAYGQEMRLPTADKYDIYWQPEVGLPVLLARGFSVKERKVMDLSPDLALGIVRVVGSGQPAPKLIALVEPDGHGPDEGYFKPIQTATRFGQDMVVPKGSYDVWLKPQQGKSQMLEGKLDVKPGEVTQIE